MNRFDSIEYLQQGTPTQRQVYSLLTSHRIFEKLSGFDPLLAGTIPININIENSDLDILCYWQDKNVYIQHLKETFENEFRFSLRENEDSVICNFFIDTFEIEIFGQNIPTRKQNGYLHMIIEYEILRSRGDKFREEIIQLKKQGYKTEPAFAKLLNIEGDPYTGLLKYKER